MADEGESLESWLNKATNPSNREDDWEYIMGFCDQVNKELEGPQISTKLIAHKIQSPQEKEALQALTVLEACVKNCGRRFHQEIGKFRFLNELIKLVSPKYLGDKTTEKVKTKVIELIYSWHIGLPHESKISDAYQMLKKQGIVTKDPTYIDESYEPPPPPRPKNALFEDDDKAKLLDRLLKSKNPEDLQAANRLIKNMVKEDSERMEKVSRRLTELETCNNNIKLLNEMLAHYKAGVTSSAELDLMKELYESCERMRPKLFTLASDTDDKDDELNDVLQANDALVRVMTIYKSVILGEEENMPIPKPTPGGVGSSLLDVDSVLLGASGEAFTDTPSVLSHLTDSQNGTAAAGASTTAQKQPVSSSAALLEDQLSSLGLNDAEAQAQKPKENYSSDLTDLLGTTAAMASPAPGFPNHHQQPTSQPVLAGAPQGFSSQPQPVTQTFAAFPTQQNFAAFGGSAMRQPVQMAPMGMGHNALGGPMQGFGSIPVRPLTSTSSSIPTKPPPAAATATESKPSPFDDLDVLSKSMLEKSKVQKQPQQAKQQSTTQQQTAQPIAKPPQAGALVDLQDASQPPTSKTVQQPTPQPMQQPVQQPTPQPTAANVVQTAPGSPGPGSGQSSPKKEVLSIADIVVPLETIQPGVHAPITVYDKNNVRTVFHFAKNSPRPDVLVVVISTMSSNTSPVKNVVFQAAVPKVMKVKLQPPSASELPAFNPILPPAAITQVMILANPNKEKVRLKYKMTYTLNEQPITEVGEVNTFPTVAS
ncbi:ADP-ribosylation factor-binding protein GGA1-like isoform X2 [Ptychodera flava]|uniref:ADP-ribosylation factor-binding protein GGA1-like isoform X2 n=1 Tax=Ptychodera flava TaxID=63121 RepID=UPI003969EE4B